MTWGNVMTVGKGTKSGKELRGLIEEIEAVRTRKAQLSEAEKEIFQRGKSSGFDTKTMRKVLMLRAQDPAKRQEAQALLDTYMHALGLDEEPPLFAAFGAMKIDLAAREAAVEFMKSIMPPTGEIVLKLGGLPIRVFRDADGNPQAEEVTDTLPSVKPLKDEEFDDTGRLPTESADERVKDRIKAIADRAEAASKAKAAAPASHT